MFRRILSLLFVVACLAVSVSCDSQDTTVPYFQNHPLPTLRGALRVLAIGNSFTIDGTAYLDDVCKGMGIDRSTFCVYVLTEGYSSLEYWSDKLRSGDVLTISRVAGFKEASVTTGTMADILSQEWDVVVLQQVSRLSVNYKSYNPHLRNLIDGVRRYCSNAEVALAWQLVHAAPKHYTEGDLASGDKRWQQIAEATQRMVGADGIDIIIPTGTAIQLARHGSLANASDLTRDNIHLCYGAGRYVAACVWAQSLFASVYERDVASCTALHEITQVERDDSHAEFLPSSSIAVTADNQEECLRCAIEACRHPYSLGLPTTASQR